MTRVLLVGYDPDTVDFSDPALPPGMTIEKIRAGIAVALDQFAARGWEAEVGFIRPDETAGPAVERLLASRSYDCVVIGAGVRLPPRRLAIFEAVINAVHKAAPGAAIAFNTRPEDSADAAAPRLPVGPPRKSLASGALTGPSTRRGARRLAQTKCVRARPPRVMADVSQRSERGSA